jgi:hypothetical protein
MSEAKRKAKFFALMERHNALGRLLPDPDALDTDDAAAVAEAKTILAEMTKVKSELDALLVRLV